MRKCEKGQAAVEFALVLPLLLLIVFGMIQTGLTLYNKHQVTNAAHVGARRASVCRQCPAPTDAITTSVKNAVNLDQSKLTVAVATPGGWNEDNDVRVTVSYPYDINVLGIPLGSGTLRAQAIARIE